MDFSVIVCTYNRSGLLRRALEALCRQTLASSEYEIIIVDNNSHDDTRVVGEDFRRRFSHIRYCFEVQQGLSHARNRGWLAAMTSLKSREGSAL